MTRTLTPDVMFEVGDVVVLTGDSWPNSERASLEGAPHRGSVVTIGRAVWQEWPGSAAGTFLVAGDPFEWVAWPHASSPFAATLIHRPSLGQKGSAS
jgi:hypothetical protein